MDADSEKGSLFASLRRFQDTAPPPLAGPPPAPPQQQAPSLQPVLERLAKIETQLSRGGAGESDKRMEALEKKLQETQEQAIAALVSLREREEAQKAAQADTEVVLKTVSTQRRSDELDRQMREQVAAQRRRIDELETRLLDAAGGAGRIEPVLAAQRMAGLKISACLERQDRLAEQVAEVRNFHERAEAAAAALCAELERLRSELGQRLERCEEGGAERLAGLREELSGLAEHWEEAAAQSRADLDRQGAALSALERVVRAEVLARVEAVKGELDARLASLAEAGSRFETEMRGMMLARILKLEERLK